MNKTKFKIENLNIYTYSILSLLIIVLSIYFYNFINTNVVKAINSRDIYLDPATIRIPDVNITRFDNVENKIKNKASSKNIRSKSFFQ